MRNPWVRGPAARGSILYATQSRPAQLFTAESAEIAEGTYSGAEPGFLPVRDCAPGFLGELRVLGGRALAARGSPTFSTWPKA